MSTRGLERVARELRDKLASIIEVRVADPRLRGVSIVEVRPSPDLSYARVFYRTLGDPGEAERALAKAKPFLRRCLAENLRLRRVPELDLRHDPTLESAQRIEHILNDIAAEREQKEAARGEEPEADESAEMDPASGARGDAEQSVEWAAPGRPGAGTHKG